LRFRDASVILELSRPDGLLASVRPFAAAGALEAALVVDRRAYRAARGMDVSAVEASELLA
jgi:hypothetical protein